MDEASTQAIPVSGVSSNPPVLTIGFPVYNGEAFMREAMDSILGQSFSDFVLIISDNASTDATEEICREYAKRDPRIVYHRQAKNMGGAWNFNRVVDLADSPFFKWISHDDVTGAGFLEQCMTEMAAAPPDVILCYPRCMLIDEEGRVLEEVTDGLDLRQERPHDRFRAYLDNYRMSNPLFGIFRTHLLRRTALHGAYASSDKVLMAEMALVGKFWELPDRLFFRRDHAGMSRKANVTPHEIASWFDPNSPRPISMMRANLFVEYSKLILSPRLRLPLMERVLSLRELVKAGGLHELRVMAGEVKREARPRFTRRERRPEAR